MNSQITLTIAGMNCQNCQRKVREALADVPGVGEAVVDLDHGQAVVKLSGPVLAEQLIAAVKKAGFEASLPSAVSWLAVSGMTCQNCVRHVREAIQGVAGVAAATVDLEGGKAQVRWQLEAPRDLNAVIQCIQAAGFEAREISVGQASQAGSPWSPVAGWRFNVVVGTLATLPLLLGDWWFQLGLTGWFRWASFALALPVQSLCGWRFYRRAWSQLKVGAANMDTLVSLGSTAAFAFSAWILFSRQPLHLYFMESAAIITLISVGHWLESLASARADSALRALLDLAPQTARRQTAPGGEESVPVASLRPGDRVVLKPGDRIPTDGEVAEGGASVNEAMLTGESLPVAKRPGDRLLAGTLNENGSLVMAVTATGEETALASIIAVVRKAQTSRAAIQRLGDRVSQVFVPAVVVIALAAGGWWWLAPASAQRVHGWLAAYLWHAHVLADPFAMAVMVLAGVLIVACPCAMGLATPVAIMAGTNAAARRGILIRDAMALEKSGRISMVLFDKTGTLTQGHAAVAAVEDVRPSASRKPALEEIVAALARPSQHPFSQALAQLSAVPLAVEEWREFRGSGVQGRLRLGSASCVVQMGSLNWLRDQGVDFQAASGFIERAAGEGSTILALAGEGRLWGLFALRDPAKPGASEVVAQLARQGKKVCLVSGDNRLTVNAIGRQLGISAEHIYAEIRPEQKAALVSQLQQQGERVAFVGDGINDAPALEQADLGIAVSKASDVAREAADIILLKSDVHAIPEALELAQATLRTIKQNLFWAFFYNAAGVPLAALGFLSPILCAAAMGLSDLVVVGNALRLHRWQAPVRPARDGY